VRADQLAALRQGPPVVLSVCPWGRTAGVDYGKIIETMIILEPLQKILGGRELIWHEFNM